MDSLTYLAMYTQSASWQAEPQADFKVGALEDLPSRNQRGSVVEDEVDESSLLMKAQGVYGRF